MITRRKKGNQKWHKTKFKKQFKEHEEKMWKAVKLRKRTSKKKIKFLCKRGNLGGNYRLQK